MPACSNPTLWRSSTYTVIPWLWIDTAPIIFAGQVNEPSGVAYPIHEFHYDSVTVGAYTDCWQFQTIIFGTAPGLDDLGRGRLRIAPDSGKVYINRASLGTSDGTFSFQDNSYFSVLDQFRPWPRIPYISDGVNAVDGTVYPATTQLRDWNLDYTVGINGRPQVNLGYGPAFAGIVDPTTNLLTVTFPGVTTYSKAYDANIASWSVDYGDGTIIAGSNPNYTFTFPVGRRHIHFTATDTNGNTKTRHILIVAMKTGTAYAPILEFDVQPRTLSLNGNQNTFNVRVRQQIPRATYPDLMNVIYGKDEFYNGTKGPLNVIGSAGATGCESVKFSGWHFTDKNNTTAEPTGYISDVALECLDAGGWLDKMPGFSIEINRMASPTSWYQQKNANIDKFIMEGLLEYQTTIRNLTDVYDSNTGDQYGISRLGCNQQTGYATCQEFMDRAIGYEFAVNAQGMIFMRPNQDLLLAANRTSVSILTLTETDIFSFNFLHQRFPKQHWNRGAYVLASTVDITSITTPQTAFFVAPGQAPGIGAQAVDYNEQLANNAVEAQQRTARRYAEDNSDFADFECVLTWPGDAGIDPAYGQWLTFNVSATYAAQRGIPLNMRARIMSVTITDTAAPTGNSSSWKIIGRFETDSPLNAADDDTPPASNVAPAPPSAPPAVIPAPDSWGSSNSYVPDGWFVGELRGLIVLLSQATSTLSARDISPVGVKTPSNSLLMYRLVQDPWNLKGLFAFYSDAILTTADYTVNPPVWTDLGVTPPSGYEWIWDFTGSINRQNYYAWIGRKTSDGSLRYYYTLDNFSTIQHTDIPDSSWGSNIAIPYYGWNGGAVQMAAIRMHSFNSFSNGIVYFQNSNGKIWKSTDWGATWTLAFSNSYGTNLPTYMNIPFSLPGGAKNTTPTYIIRDDNNNMNPNFQMTNKIWRDGTNNFVLSPVLPDNKHWVASNQAMNSFTLDGNYAIIIFADGTANTAPYLVRTTDGGVTWTELAFTNRSGPYHGVNGWPTNKDFYVIWGGGGGLTGTMFYTADGGNTQNSVLSAYDAATAAIRSPYSLQNMVIEVIPNLFAKYPVGGVHP